eukprot:2839353-Pyramimonas_sp.AAC.1
MQLATIRAGGLSLGERLGARDLDINGSPALASKINLARVYCARAKQTVQRVWLVPGRPRVVATCAVDPPWCAQWWQLPLA